MPNKLRTIIIDIISALLVCLFLYAAVSKILDYRKFKVQLGQSPLLTSFASWVAFIIPAIEIIISVMLIFPKSSLLGLYAAFGLMTMFTAYIIAITKFSDDVPCSCGGVLENMTWNQHMVFNIGFIIMALFGLLFYSKEEKRSTLE